MNKTLISLLLLVFTTLAAHADDQQPILSKKGTFQDVRDDLVTAIESRGLKINHTNHISDMLDRTGAAVGDTRQIYVQAEQVEFCKADLSRKMMSADPANIVYCPYIISIYTKPDAPGEVFLSYRKPLAIDPNPATAEALKDVDALLSGILDDAIQGAF